MTKKEFLKELEKRFSMVGRVVELSKDSSGKVNSYEVWVLDIRGNLRDQTMFPFWVENEGEPNERAFTPHPEENKLKRFKERFEKKCESIQISRERGLIKKEFLKELKKKFDKIEEEFLDDYGFESQKLNLYLITVGDGRGNLYASESLRFFVEDEGTSTEKAYMPHPEEDKLKRFKERFRKKVASLQIS